MLIAYECSVNMPINNIILEDWHFPMPDHSLTTPLMLAKNDLLALGNTFQPLLQDSLEASVKA